ncbi:MAG: riboflavin biosynthesis protein RibF [Bacteroidetes bacterium GWE2_41_25]|nr:MAG: riboflavin biosynthesis protein RibF [Bacteroidetes bacterium GWA2_40_15]OFX95078.1 MAG: riboflavin biosynthesis protein RibF [Bacteroidetes bacterium GWE2_41_25]OFY58049.1 MAG: riboflavin biosynthesis protein RibF [Bacteroidetes bacterium GWF2_41_9]HAM11604.1 riboflavin biosynthesis protein RibF [Bacteroidales bacterium]HBH82779.1 riboflavin biosynthesis protein RibF [Bacteroidales bacterium]
MVIHYGYEDLVIVSPVVTLGIFDGVHRGHMVLIDCLIKRAKETGGESVVITFSPHPRLVLERDHLNLTFLTTPDEKKDLLEKAGIDHLVIIDFSREFSRMHACDFVKDILADRIGTKYLIVGHDHHFGRNGEGDFDTIRQCSGLHDFRLEKVQGLQTEGGTISSSLIRDALLSGRLDNANKLLGYEYSLTGTIVEGKKIGRSIGFPTANIRPEIHKLIPGNGVYAVEVITDDGSYPGMLSIGTNPTINKENGIRSIEVNILNFDRDIYGNNLTVIFRKRLRDEFKFDNVEQLAFQMSRDKEDTLKLFT